MRRMPCIDWGWTRVSSTCGCLCVCVGGGGGGGYRAGQTMVLQAEASCSLTCSLLPHPMRPVNTQRIDPALGSMDPFTAAAVNTTQPIPLCYTSEPHPALRTCTHSAIMSSYTVCLRSACSPIQVFTDPV